MNNCEMPVPVLVGKELFEMLSDAHGVATANRIMESMRRKSFVRQLKEEARVLAFVKGETR